MSIIIHEGGTSRGIQCNIGNTYYWNAHSFWPSFEDQNFDISDFDPQNSNLLSPLSTFDLTGFQPGNEVVMCVIIYQYDTNQDGYINMDFYDTENTLCYSSSVHIFNDDVDGNTWRGATWSAVGVRPKPWPEIWENGIYRVEVSGLVTATYYYTITDLDETRMTRYPGNEGTLWIEGEYLHYISDIGTKHFMRHDGSSTFVGTEYSGNIWIKDTEWRICWIDQDGYKRQSKLGDQYWVNDEWAPAGGGTINPGTAYKGYIWMDTFYWTKLKFIANDGQMIRIGPGYVYTGDFQ